MSRSWLGNGGGEECSVQMGHCKAEEEVGRGQLKIKILVLISKGMRSYWRLFNREVT